MANGDDARVLAAPVKVAAAGEVLWARPVPVKTAEAWLVLRAATDGAMVLMVELHWYVVTVSICVTAGSEETVTGVVSEDTGVVELTEMTVATEVLTGEEEGTLVLVLEVDETVETLETAEVEEGGPAEQLRLYSGVVDNVPPTTPKLGLGVTGLASWRVYQ